MRSSSVRRSGWFVLLATAAALACSSPSSNQAEEHAGTARQALGAPTITSLSPSAAAQGATVTVAGSGFTDATAVTFNGSAASFTVTSDTSLTTVVPAGATTGKVSVTTPLGSKTSTAVFKVRPTLADFAPASGAAGTAITLHGTGLTGALAVKLGSASLAFNVVSDTAIVATTPALAPNGKLVVSTLGGTVTSVGTFIGAGPQVTAFSPAAAKQGVTINVTGQGFVAPSAVTFAGLNATSVTVLSPTKLQAIVPAGATSGVIEVTTALGSGASVAALQVLPTISSFSPTNGAPSTTVHLVGTAFTAATRVAFGAATDGSFTVLNDREIDAVVPAGATTAKLSVTNPGGAVTSSGVFTLQSAPVITSFTPAATTQGSSVTLLGTGMLGVTSANVSGTPATVTSSSATAVKIVVPAFSVAGPIEIANAAGSARTASSLGIKPKVIGFSPAAGAVGTVVTVTGGGLTGASAVKFGTKVATFTVIDDATVSATVPAGFSAAKLTITTPGGSAVSSGTFAIASSPIITSVAPTAAPVGATVTLLGSNFATATAVQFHGVPATFSVLSNTSLTAVVPAGATSGPISISNPSGSGSSAASFAVLPTLSSFSPAGGGPGTYVLLNGTGLDAVTGVMFGTKPAFFFRSGTNLYTMVPQLTTPQALSITLVTPDGSSMSAATFMVDRCFEVTCTPFDSCMTGGSCNPSTGFCDFDYRPDGSTCDDGSACTQVDTCQNGECHGDSPVVCDAPGACHGPGRCDDTTGACDYPRLPTRSSCSDGDACNGKETCDATGSCVAAVAPSLDDGDSCTTDACDASYGVTHLRVAGCGIPEAQPLPAPPPEFDDRLATSVVGGVELIDPQGALSGLSIQISPRSGAASMVAGADDAWSIEPTGPLAKVVYARFPLSSRLPDGSTMLLWSRTTASGPFTLQSVARVIAGGSKAIVGLKHFSEQALAPLMTPRLAGQGGRIERITDTTHTVELSASAGGTLAYKQLDIYNFPDVYSLFSGVQSFPSDFSGRIRQAASTSAFVRTTPLGEVALWTGELVTDAFEPSLSSTGARVVYRQGDQIVLHGEGPLSTNEQGEPASGVSDGPEVTPGGRFVAFRSDALDLDDFDPARGIFVRDLELGTVERLPLDDVEYDHLQVAAVPSAVSDGGRFVFLQSIAEARVFDETTCHVYYRFDRQEQVLEQVADGDWIAPDRGGRTVVSHPCRKIPDNFVHYDGFATESDFLGFDPYDYGTTHTWSDVSLGRLIVRDIKRDLTAPFGPVLSNLTDVAGSSVNSVNTEYYVTNMNAGAVSGDGNLATYVLNGRGFETPRWRETWKSPVPSPTPPPTVTPDDTIYEYDDFSVAYANMLAETPGDLLVLSAGSEVLEVLRTFGQRSGTLDFEGLPAGFYSIDAYYALDADPVILKQRSSTGFEIKKRIPHVEVAGGACEFAPFTVEFEDFLAKAPGDRVVLETMGGAAIETLQTDGESDGMLAFSSRLDEGEYRLRVQIALPTDPPSFEDRGVFAVTVNACPAIVGNAGNQRFVTCSNSLVSNFWLTQDWEAPAITPDGRRIVYTRGAPFPPSTPGNPFPTSQQDVVAFDRKTNSETILAEDVRGFGASPNGRFVAWVQDRFVYVADLEADTVHVIETNMSQWLSTSVAVQLSDDGNWVTYSDTRYLDSGALTFLSLWNRSSGTAERVTGAFGCQPSLSADGRWLGYVDYTSATDPPDSARGWEGFLLDTNDPTKPSSNGPVINSQHANLGRWSQSLGQPDLFISSYRIALSPSGNQLAFSSHDWPGHTPIENPMDPFEQLSSVYGYTQQRDGAHRRYSAPLRVSDAPFAIADDGTLFLSPDSTYYDPGLYAVLGDGTFVQLSSGSSASRIRVATGKHRAVFVDSANNVRVVPY